MPLLQKFQAILGSFYIKLLVVLLLVVPISALIGDAVYTQIAASSFDKQAAKIADEFDNSDIAPDQVLRTMDRFGLSWLYVTEAAGNVNPKYKAFAPDLTDRSNTSRSVRWHGHRYYEVTAQQGNRIIHAGFRLEPLFDLLHGLPIPFFYALTIIGFTSLATFFCFHILVSRPLKRLPNRLGKTLAGQKLESGEVNGLMVASQISVLDAALTKEATEFKTKLMSELTEAKGNVREVMARERQQKFANSLIRELHEADSSDALFQLALHNVQDRYSSQVPVALGFALNKGRYELRGHFGLTQEQVRPITRVPKVDAFGKPMESGLTQIVASIQELEGVAPSAKHSICITPIMHKQKAYGVFVFYIFGDDVTAAELQPAMKEVTECTAQVVPTMLALEAEMEANRSDEMTGVTKIKYLDAHLERLRGVLKQDERVSALLLEGDGFIQLNTQYGKDTGNELIKELCRLVVAGVTPAEVSGGLLPMQTQVFRLGAAGFFVVLRVCDSKKASLVAERLRKYIEQYRGWPGGVPGWTVSIVHSTAPENVEDLSELLGECEVTRDYLKASKKTNSTLPSSAVPKQFRQKHQGNELGGNLTIFQPAALLQSLSTARRTGLMTVKSKAGDAISIYVENGVPKKARLKQLNGEDAIIEFVSTFEEGEFNFREFRTNLGSDSMTNELTGLGSAQFDVTKPLESLLLDGALAQDHIAAAKKAIPQLGLFLIRELKANDASAWESVTAVAEPPSEIEIAAMKEIVKLGMGATTLQEIVSKKMATTPTHVSLRAAQLLYEHKLIKLSPVKMLATF